MSAVLTTSGERKQTASNLGQGEIIPLKFSIYVNFSEDRYVIIGLSHCVYQSMNARVCITN